MVHVSELQQQRVSKRRDACRFEDVSHVWQAYHASDYFVSRIAPLNTFIVVKCIAKILYHAVLVYRAQFTVAALAQAFLELMHVMPSFAYLNQA